MKERTMKFRLSDERQIARCLAVRCKQAWGQLKRWWQLAEQRRQLALLDDRALHDLGLSRADVMQESERPFWDDPLAK